mmetsp:Transcript_29739/g.45608  ORF Transcript_29739/g.45608 Transcript_29739/m.45608 type:complete len:179 (+) Transcript_29739:562-1098(+)
MRKAGMPLKDALSLVQSHRPEAHPIPGFIAQLEKYETKCRRMGVLTKGKEEIGSSSSSTKKRKIGPQIGPSRGPVGEQEEDSNSSTKVRSIGPSIGPAGPPVKRATVCSGKSSIGPSLGPSKRSKKDDSVAPRMIGPSIGPLPPPVPPSSDNESSKSTPTTKVIGPSIGPSGPPMKKS